MLKPVENNPGHQEGGLNQDLVTELVAQGKAAYAREAYAAAATAFEEAAAALGAVGQTTAAAEMSNNAAVAWLQGGDPETALRMVTGTAEIFGQAGDLHRQAMALGNLGMALDELGRLEEAAAAYEESSGLLRQLKDFDQRLYVLQALSKVYFRQGKPLLAVTAMRAGVDLVPNPSPRQRLLRWLLKIPDQFMPQPR